MIWIYTILQGILSSSLNTYMYCISGHWHGAQKRNTVWRETLVVGKFGELSAKPPLAK